MAITCTSYCMCFNQIVILFWYFSKTDKNIKMSQIPGVYVSRIILGALAYSSCFPAADKEGQLFQPSSSICQTGAGKTPGCPKVSNVTVVATLQAHGFFQWLLLALQANKHL